VDTSTPLAGVRPGIAGSAASTRSFGNLGIDRRLGHVGSGVPGARARADRDDGDDDDGGGRRRGRRGGDDDDGDRRRARSIVESHRPFAGAARPGGVSYGGGGALAARRQGVVSYGHSHPGHFHGHGRFHGRSHVHGLIRSHHGIRPWWLHRGPRYGFGFGLTWYDPWPWYDTWGFGTTTIVYEPVPVPVYVPEPVYVDPGFPAPLVHPPGAVPPAVAPGVVPPAAPAPLAPQAPAPGQVAPLDEATRQGLEEAFEAFRAQRFADAFARLDGLVRANPGSGEAWMGRFYAAFALGIWPEAATSLARAGELGAFPRGYRFDPRPLYDAGRAEGEPSLFEALFARLADHLNAHPTDPNGYAVMAYLHVALGRETEARAALASLAALRPADPLLPALRTASLPPEQPPTTPGPPAQPPLVPTLPPAPPATGPFPPPR
jgi:hypothetical protein